VLDPLYFEALAISVGGETAFLLSGDVIDYPYPWILRIRESVAAATGCDPRRLLFSCNHNHCSSPVPTDASPEARKAWEEANEHMINGAIQACMEAFANRRPAEIAFCTLNLPEPITQNRRIRLSSGTCLNCWGAGAFQPFGQKLVEPAGDDNTRVDALCFREVGATAPFGIFISYASHQHLYELPYFSGEFVGGAKRAIEKRIPGATAMQSTQACGDLDIHCIHPMPDEHEAQVQWFRDSQHRLGERFADAVVPEIAKAVYSRPTQMRHAYVSTEEEPTDAQKPSYILNHLCVGDIAMVSFPGEVMFEFGQWLYQQSPFPRLFPLAYNGSGGVGMYLPAEHHYEEGSYEVMRGPDYWRPEFARRRPTEEIFERMVQTLRELKG